MLYTRSTRDLLTHCLNYQSIKSTSIQIFLAIHLTMNDKQHSEKRQYEGNMYQRQIEQILHVTNKRKLLSILYCSGLISTRKKIKTQKQQKITKTCFDTHSKFM